jgi:glycosyltransferase involved in cell wall biosynthesis
MSTPPDSPPVISVIVLTYNHERYIEQALTSVLTQTNAPPHEILVAEDYSTDGTQSVLRDLQTKHPGRFTVLDRGRNLGLSANLEDALNRCRGRYVAILEGDDWWCDPQKLHKVAAALDAHPDWTGCFHATRQVTDRPRLIPTVLPEPFPDRPVTIDDLLMDNRIPTYSAVTYRRGVVTAFPEWHRRQINGDWGLHILHAAHGPIGFLPEIMTAYRVHERGMWTGMSLADKWRQEHALWTNIDRQFEGRYADRIQTARDQFFTRVAEGVENLRRIERRYHALQLDRMASALQPMRSLWRRIMSPFQKPAKDAPRQEPRTP